jgi:glycosidase
MGKPISASWFSEAIVYHILVDRYAGYHTDTDPKKPVFLGGNLTGIAERIPYLVELGINTILLSPIFETTQYHGYHITDFYTTDKRFGSENNLRLLIELAHDHNIRVIIDFVPNHCSRQHPFFQQALADRRSRYRKWFYFNSLTNSYLCFLHYRDLPKINLDFPEARNYIINAARHWINTGADGFRLDHAIGPSHDFWKAFRNEIKSVDREAVLIGEAWLEGIRFNDVKSLGISHKYRRWLHKFKPWDVQAEYVGEFDGVLDFYFRHRITENIAWQESSLNKEEQLFSQMMNHYKRFPENFFLPSFIDNHDMNRFLFDAGQNRDKLKAALRLQFSLPQPPILYYGTECGMTHYKPVHWDVPYSDIQVRQPMPWDALDYELINYCKGLIRKRLKK